MQLRLEWGGHVARLSQPDPTRLTYRVFHIGVTTRFAALRINTTVDNIMVDICTFGGGSATYTRISGKRGFTRLSTGTGGTHVLPARRRPSFPSSAPDDLHLGLSLRIQCMVRMFFPARSRPHVPRVSFGLCTFTFLHVVVSANLGQRRCRISRRRIPLAKKRPHTLSCR